MKRDTGGWIKLYRQLLSHEMFRFDHKATIVFLALLMIADSNGKVKIGRFILSKITGIKSPAIWPILKRLEKKWKITTQASNNRFTEIFILNWQKYQCSDNSQQHKPATTQQQHSNTLIRIKNKENPPYPPTTAEGGSGGSFNSGGAPPASFDFNVWLEGLLKSDNLARVIIGQYVRAKDMRLDTGERATQELNRLMPIAKQLAEWPANKVKATRDYLEERGLNWTLQTLLDKVALYGNYKQDGAK